MTKQEFLTMMEFPIQWIEFYPDELFTLQKEAYTPGEENSSEHYRAGAVNWWLHRNISVQEALQLIRLLKEDSDQLMACGCVEWVLEKFPENEQVKNFASELNMDTRGSV